MAGFEGRVVVVTGAGGGLGREYALLFASMGASVVVNDLGGSVDGEGGASGRDSPAGKVVAEICGRGGKAVADFHSVMDGDKIVDTALKNFGRVDVLINNAGIIRDKSFVKMSEADWDAVLGVHLHGAYSVTRAAWPVMIKQKYGRIIMTSSAAGLYGNFGQANYSSAKMALVGMAKSLAFEGAKHNILCNVVAPLAASRISETAFPKEILDILQPSAVAPVVVYMSHESFKASGMVVETGAGFVAALRWERAEGYSVNPKKNPGAVDDLKKNWNKVGDFHASSSYPDSISQVPWMELLEKNIGLKTAAKSQFRLDDRVIIVTGAGSGLGRAYALFLASLGASIVVNDVGKGNPSPAEKVVAEIKTQGGRAVASSGSVVDSGNSIVELAIKTFGRLDAVVNNAGILRDKSFVKMEHADWKSVLDVHLKGSFGVSSAAWAVFSKQGYGRIVNTTSAVGLYGNFGQVNYSAAKAALIGLTKSLAIEGAKKNIMVNAVAPNAGTAMTATILPSEMVDALSPDYVAPMVAFLCSPDCCESGSVFEAGSGWFSKVRLQRSAGVHFQAINFDQIAAKWDDICNFEQPAPTYPTSPQEAFGPILQARTKSENRSQDAHDGGKMKGGMEFEHPGAFEYTFKDVILYALGIGAKESDLKWVYERSSDFQMVPTFGVIPGLTALFSADFSGPSEWASTLPSFDLMSLLHGEQSLELLVPIDKIPTSGSLVSSYVVKNVEEKGSAGREFLNVTVQVTSKDAKSGQAIFRNESILILRGVKYDKTRAKSNVEGNSGSTRKIPDGAPTWRVSSETRRDQAALYRLSGDLNPLHIDPQFASMGGFKSPILHGLCTFGIACRSILESMSDSAKLLKSIRGRFAKPVFPGDTLITEIWKEGSNVIFQVVSKEDPKNVVLSHGFATFVVNDVPHKSPSEKGMIFSELEKNWSGLSESKRKQLVSKFKSVLKFKLSEPLEEFWFVLKDEKDLECGVFCKVPENVKSDLSLEMKTTTFSSLVSGKLSPQQAFMKGLVKLNGKMSLAMSLEGLLKELAGVTSRL